MSRRDILEQRALIEKWIAEHRPKAFMCRQLRCKQSTLNSYLVRMQIKYAGNMGGSGMDKWLDEPIPIEFHHVNGDPFDNRIENLQILCPNRLALTDNNAGRGVRIQPSGEPHKGLKYVNR